MNCPYCGKIITDNAKFCSGCGKNLQQQPVYYQQPRQQYYQPQMVQQTIITDSSSPGAFILGFLIPIVISFILYMMWHKETPKKAQSLLVGMMVRIIPSVIAIVLLFSWMYSS